MAKAKATKSATKQTSQASGPSASRLIDARIRELAGWRGETLARVRSIIVEACPVVVEEWKWRGTPVWSCDGIICTGESYANVVKLTFAHGAALPDPAGLFNASLEGNTRRAIDLHEGDKVNAKALKALVKAAAALNASKKAKPVAKKAAPGARPANGVTLLSGGNPQIAKGDGNGVVQAYIAAMPGWKQEIGRWIDELVDRNVPQVLKAVRWNSPFYGIEDRGWFLSVHCLTRYVKLTFFNGEALRPIPPGGTVKSKEARWLDVYEADLRDDGQMASWLKQAAKLPGWVP